MLEGVTVISLNHQSVHLGLLSKLPQTASGVYYAIANKTAVTMVERLSVGC